MQIGTDSSRISMLLPLAAKMWLQKKKITREFSLNGKYSAKVADKDRINPSDVLKLNML
jgi:hypothetical protein